MKILMLLNTSFPVIIGNDGCSGTEIYVSDVATELTNQGHEVHIVSTLDSINSDDRITIHQIPMYSSHHEKSNGQFNWKLQCEFTEKIIKDHNFDVAFVNSTHHQLTMLTLGLGLPTLTKVHVIPGGNETKLLHLMMTKRPKSNMIFNSELTKSKFTQLYPYPLPKTLNLNVLELGIPRDDPGSYHINYNYLTTSGRWDPKKGILTSIKLVDEFIRKYDQPIRLDIIGLPSGKADYNNQILSELKNVNTNITWNREFSGSRSKFQFMIGTYRPMVCSFSVAESFGLSTLDAWQNGLPMLTENYPQSYINKLVTRGDTIYRNNDFIITKLGGVANKGKFNSMLSWIVDNKPFNGKEIYDYFINNYTIEIYTKKLISELEDLQTRS